MDNTIEKWVAILFEASPNFQRSVGGVGWIGYSMSQSSLKRVPISNEAVDVLPESDLGESQSSLKRVPISNPHLLRCRSRGDASVRSQSSLKRVPISNPP